MKGPQVSGVLQQLAAAEKVPAASMHRLATMGRADHRSGLAERADAEQFNCSVTELSSPAEHPCIWPGTCGQAPIGRANICPCITACAHRAMHVSPFFRGSTFLVAVASRAVVACQVEPVYGTLYIQQQQRVESKAKWAGVVTGPTCMPGGITMPGGRIMPGGIMPGIIGGGMSVVNPVGMPDAHLTPCIRRSPSITDHHPSLPII